MEQPSTALSAIWCERVKRANQERKWFLGVTVRVVCQKTNLQEAKSKDNGGNFYLQFRKENKKNCLQNE